MIWDDVQTKLKTMKNLVFAMDQGQTAPTTEPGPWGESQNGYCLGLVVEWIAMRYAGKDFPFDPTTLVCDYPPWQATRAQNVYLKHSDEDDFHARFKQAFGDYGLMLNRGRDKSFDQAMFGDDLVRAAHAHFGCYYVRLLGPKSAHAVAFQRIAAEQWRFFDPNIGEFQSADHDEFAFLIDWYSNLQGYDQRYTTNTRVVGINPPPYVNHRVFKARTSR